MYLMLMVDSLVHGRPSTFFQRQSSVCVRDPFQSVHERFIGFLLLRYKVSLDAISLRGTSMIFVVTGVVTFLVQVVIYPFFHSTLHWSYSMKKVVFLDILVTLSLIGGFAICIFNSSL